MIMQLTRPPTRIIRGLYVAQSATSFAQRGRCQLDLLLEKHIPMEMIATRLDEAD